MIKRLILILTAVLTAAAGTEAEEMAINKENFRRVELTAGIVRDSLPVVIGEGDIEADRIGVEVYRGGEPADITGVSCVGYFVRQTGDTVVIPGTAEEHKAWVDLPQACYAYEGQFSLAIKLTGGDVTGTMRIVDGIVARTTTDTVIDPGSVVPDLATLLAQIDACEQATEAAEAVATQITEEYSSSKSYDPGDYVTYNSHIYRNTHPISGGEAWNANHWVQVSLADDLTELMETMVEANKGSAVVQPTEGLDITNNGVHAVVDDGVLKISGTPTSSRRIIFMNGNNAAKSTSGVFVKTLPAGRYFVSYSSSGPQEVKLDATYTTFNDYFAVRNNSIAVFDAPVMIGARATYNVNYGTDENPTEFTVDIRAIGADSGRELTVRYIQDGESGGTGTGPNDTTEHLTIDIPSKTDGGAIRYIFGHSKTAANNCNVWRIVYLYNLPTPNAGEGGATRASASGEWECALHLAGRDDFSGGFTHGDENDCVIAFFADGKIISDISDVDLLSCEEFRVVRTTNLYDPSDHTTVIAKHGCEYVWTADGLEIRQSVKWQVSAELANCFLAMFPVRKAYSGYRYDDVNFTIIENDQTGYSVAIPNARRVVEFTPQSMISDFSVPVYPEGLTGGDQANVSDNSGLDYNKVYFKICGEGQSVTAGDLWKSVTKYEIQRN